jgi:hypothetical protein
MRFLAEPIRVEENLGSKGGENGCSGSGAGICG